MTEPDPVSRYALLAHSVARRPLPVVAAPAGTPAHATYRLIAVDLDVPAPLARAQVALHAALVASGSLDRAVCRQLVARPRAAQRYFAVEATRVADQLATSLPRIAATLAAPAMVGRLPGSPSESLEFALGRQSLPAVPGWWGEIRPLVVLSTRRGDEDGGNDRLPRRLSSRDDITVSDEEPGEPNVLQKLLNAPGASSNPLARLLNAVFGGSLQRAPGVGEADASAAAVVAGSSQRSRMTHKDLVVNLKPAHRTGKGMVPVRRATRYPEWNHHRRCYLPEHCRVQEVVADRVGAGGPRSSVGDPVVQAQLVAVGRSRRWERRQSTGTELDLDAVIDARVEHAATGDHRRQVYLAVRQTKPDLAVMVLVDGSGSTEETSSTDGSVHERQGAAAATLVASLANLGVRVAACSFNSMGPDDVRVTVLKRFSEPSLAGFRARLAGLEPSGFTRLGAAVRHTVRILRDEGGTTHRLLVVISDGFVFDRDGYEGVYGEADTRMALREARMQGVGSVCLVVGAPAGPARLESVFGRSGFAAAADLKDLRRQLRALARRALADADVRRVS